MSSSLPSAANASAAVLKCSEPGMCLARKPHSLSASTSLKGSCRCSFCQSSARSMARTSVGFMMAKTLAPGRTAPRSPFGHMWAPFQWIGREDQYVRHGRSERVSYSGAVVAPSRRPFGSGDGGLSVIRRLLRGDAAPPECSISLDGRQLYPRGRWRLLRRCVRTDGKHCGTGPLLYPPSYGRAAGDTNGAAGLGMGNRRMVEGQRAGRRRPLWIRARKPPGRPDVRVAVPLLAPTRARVRSGAQRDGTAPLARDALNETFTGHPRISPSGRIALGSPVTTSQSWWAA